MRKWYLGTLFNYWVQYDNGIIVYNTMIIIIVCLFVTEVLAISMNKFYNGWNVLKETADFHDFQQLFGSHNLHFSQT